MKVDHPMNSSSQITPLDNKSAIPVYSNVPRAIASVSSNSSNSPALLINNAGGLNSTNIGINQINAITKISNAVNTKNNPNHLINATIANKIQDIPISPQKQSSANKSNGSNSSSSSNSPEIAPNGSPKLSRFQRFAAKFSISKSKKDSAASPAPVQSTSNKKQISASPNTVDPDKIVWQTSLLGLSTVTFNNFTSPMSSTESSNANSPVLSSTAAPISFQSQSNPISNLNISQAEDNIENEEQEGTVEEESSVSMSNPRLPSYSTTNSKPSNLNINYNYCDTIYSCSRSIPSPPHSPSYSKNNQQSSKIHSNNQQIEENNQIEQIDHSKLQSSISISNTSSSVAQKNLTDYFGENLGTANNHNLNATGLISSADTTYMRVIEDESEEYEFI